MQPRKRKAHDDMASRVALESGYAVSAVLESFKTSKQMVSSVRMARRQANEMLYDLPNTTTPFGALCQHTIVPGKKEDLDIYHVNPAAFIYQALLVSMPFRVFLDSCRSRAPAGVLTVALYLDEATPGNQRRPDHGRSSQCIYWTILEFPQWFICRASGWLPFAYVQVSELKKAGLDDSMLVRFILREFAKHSCEGSDFTIIVPDGSGGDYTFKFVLKLQVADWPQHKKTFNLTGFNGTVCCFWCGNCIGRCCYFVDARLVHFASTEYHRFLRHTYDSVLEVVTHLEHTAIHNRGQLKAEQQSTGYKYDPDGLMWDPLARSRLRLPEAGYFDWMHILVASGGVAQFQLNQLVLVLEDHGIKACDLDEWFSLVVVPKGFTKLKKTFFQDRVVNNRKAHIRAFASELLTAIVLMGLFLDVVVAPLAIAALDDHIACFTLLACIVSLLQKSNINDLADFRSAVWNHHVLFYQCYPECFKTKGHALQHVADCWEFWGVLLSCFSPERNHRLMKRVMSFSYKRATQTTLAYGVRNWFANLDGENAFIPVHFVGNVYAVHGAPAIPLLHHGIAEITHWCKKLRLPLGLIEADDLIRFTSLDGVCGFGIVVGFARCQLPASNVFAAVIQVCMPTEGHIPGLRFLRQTGKHGLITSGQVSAAVPFVDLGGSIVPARHA
jgi:hypothetical protein